MKFLFLFISIFSFAQEQVTKGIVLDKDTNNPIPYVNISILESQIGTSSDEDGSYNLIVSEKDFNRYVHLSSLGYKDTTLTVISFLKLKSILLKPSVEELNEVVISNKFENKFTEINKIKKKRLRGGYAPGMKPWILALHFPYDEKYSTTRYLKELTVYVNRSSFIKKHKSKFRIRIYEVDDIGMPGEDLLTDDIVVETTKKQKEVLIDLSDNDIIFPATGLYVALEGLAIPFNAFDDMSTYVNAKGEKISREVVRYAPNFSATVEKKDKVKVVKYDNGEWYDFKVPLMEKNKTLVPAISLTLSN